MHVRKIVILSLLFVLTQPLVAQAVKDGVSAPGHPRIVALYFKGQSNWPHPIQSCTGFLYSPRIVFTAAHCVHDGTRASQKIKLKPNQLWVGSPGALTGVSATKHDVLKIYSKRGYDHYGERSYSYRNDFAVIVLKKAIANIPPATLPTKAEVDLLVASGSKVSTGGYGGTSANDLAQGEVFRKIYPQMAHFNLIPFDEGYRSVQERMAMWNRNFYQSDGVSYMRYEPGTAHPCNGDSGSGFFIQKGSKFTYLGVTWSGVHPLCEKDDVGNTKRFKPASGYVVAFRGVYTDLPLIEKAIKYSRKN